LAGTALDIPIVARGGYMKKTLSISLVLLSLSSFASVDDFNSLIDENNKVQKQLTQKLQKQLDTKNLGKRQKPDFHAVGEDVVGRGGENVAVETKGLEQSSLRNKPDLEKKNFKRLSQEFKELK
jgi:hypothetical protein